jgi:ABC-type multidrug transport system ATPase subunit
MIGSPPMVPDLTVLDHVMLVATTWADNLRAAARVTHGVLTESGLDSLGERFPHELSSEQTQLFGLALVLARPRSLPQPCGQAHYCSDETVAQRYDPPFSLTPSPSAT